MRKISLGKDEKGAVLDASTLGAGVGSSYAGCTFAFTMDVPDTAASYVFTVGQRRDVTVSHADMAANGWAVRLLFGG